MNKIANRAKGALYEKCARVFLTNKGLKFIAANQYFKCGELDLIMQENNTIVFVEIKQRTSDKYGLAKESISYTKQQRLVKSASLWLLQHNMSLETTNCRFDCVAFGDSPDKLEWIKNIIEYN